MSLRKFALFVALVLVYVLVPGPSNAISRPYSSWSPSMVGARCVGSVSRHGGYQIDDGWVRGWATLRCSGGWRRGSGIYSFRLPEPVGVRDWGPIGTVTLGRGFNHRVGNLHVRDKYTSSGVGVIDGGLFVSHSNPWPGKRIDNMHWQFQYPTR